MKKHFEMLKKYGFLTDIDEDDYENPICFINTLNSGWDLWEDLKKFTSKTSITLEEIIVDLNFRLLD